jgi:hypothetical protein
MAAATSYLNPESWWARYVPQLALLPVFLLIPVILKGRGWTRKLAQILGVILLFNTVVSAASAVGASVAKSLKLEHAFAEIARQGGVGEYWAYRNPARPGESWVYSNPESKVHYEQFSGHQGIVICAEINAPGAALPQGGFPVGLNMRGATEVTLYPGKCSAGAPF